ncbi:MAG: hypothetical protein IKL14_04225 [Alphaproteobacteria bacterium]|nr:hypothetical protein [Alphaproteobacteria bacterium]
MRDDEKMFRIGLWTLGIGLLISVVIFPVAFRTQGRQLKRVQREIVALQQKIAVKEAEFASFITPEKLRNSVDIIAPKSKTVAFSNAVWVGDLPDKKEK